MLVLSRKPGESILIGDDVVVTVIAVRGDQVRLGVHAPRSTPVHRSDHTDPDESADDETAAEATAPDRDSARTPARTGD